MRPLTPKHTPEQRILNAAANEFAAKGFFGARTQAIADQAGVNKAMLHYYFRTKEKLYSQVIRTTIEQILTQVGQAWTVGGPVAERLGRMVDVYIENIFQNSGIIKIVLREVTDGGLRLRKSLLDAEIHNQLLTRLDKAYFFTRIGEELRMDRRETIHFLLNLVGMCFVSFTSPLILETIADFETSNFEIFLKDRKTAIRSMLAAYTNERIRLVQEGCVP